MTEQETISYALAKQIPAISNMFCPATLTTSYGEIPLDLDDWIAVERMLQSRFEKKMKKLNMG